jgi:hypothetical protein
VPISTAYFTNPSHQYMCLHVYPPIVDILIFFTRQRPGKHVPTATNTRNNRRIVGRLCPLLGNNSVNTFLRNQELLGPSSYMLFVS